MHDTAMWTETLPGNLAGVRSPDFRRALALCALILAATAGLSGVLYFHGKQSLQAPRPGASLGASPAEGDLSRRVDQVALNVTALAAVGVGGCLVLVFMAGASWRGQVLGRLRQNADEWQTTISGLQAQLAELRRVREQALLRQADLEEKVKTLSASNAQLQGEMDKRNRAELVLTRRRQELESSKSVLEMHVQARSQQLEQLQRRYEMILNAAGEGICGLDLDGKATFVNPTVAKLTGWPVAELLGKSEQEIFFRHGQGAPPVATDRNPDEAVFYRKDGTCFSVECVKTPILENERPVGSVLVFKDITERKRAEEVLNQRAAELARSNAELEQFAFVASHDLQEPLRKIQAFGDRLKIKCEALQTPETKDYLERMQGAAARMRTLINDLLAFSRVIRRSEPFVEVDLEALTREILVDLEVRIERSGAQVEIGALPKLEADPMQMRQLMLNLISNALKFQPAGAKPLVKIAGRAFTSAAGEPLCELSVQDNGIGFEEKYLDKIFAVFQRLHGRAEYEGTGVGLAVCRRIVDRHHGTITARSRPGEGATFLVTLPLRQTKPEATP